MHKANWVVMDSGYAYGHVGPNFVKRVWGGSMVVALSKIKEGCYVLTLIANVIVLEIHKMKYPISEEKEKSSIKEKSTLVDKSAETTDVDVSLASEVAKGAAGGRGGKSLEDNILNVLNMVQEHVLSEKDVIKTILKTHNDQLRTITELLADHGKAIQALLTHVNTTKDDQGGKKIPKLRVAASVRSGRRKPANVELKDKTTREKKSTVCQEMPHEKPRAKETMCSSSKRKSPRCMDNHGEKPR
ncbi:uncharacterized protein DS421_12g368800 [Arachis hypogaea]|nr:uncharacterized protein DS421_12g368800 [Arachis hypogaea]